MNARQFRQYQQTYYTVNCYKEKDMSHLWCIKANFYCRHLTNTDLCGADLRSADLRCADLRSADLRGADLTDANLTGANLRGADLHGVVGYER